MTAWTAPSSGSLARLSNEMDDDKAELLRRVWKCRTWKELEAAYPDSRQVENEYHSYTFGMIKRAIVNRITRSHGVAHLGYHRRTGRQVYLCEAGDTYAPTLAFYGRKMVITTFGDLVERRVFVPPQQV